MIFLTEISLKRTTAFEITLSLDPLVASDQDYCAKTWMAGFPGVACRPWRTTTLRDGVRITGWRKTCPSESPYEVYTGSKQITFLPGEKATFAARFIPIRRNSTGPHDAAEGRSDPVKAYKSWLSERLIDISPAATTDSIDIHNFTHRRVTRKISRDKQKTTVRDQIIPVADAVVEMTILNVEAFESWLLVGVGPQKGFGYGAFLPAPETRGQ